MSAALFAISGAVAAAFQVRLLLRAARGPATAAFLCWIGRWLPVGLVLVTAARSGNLLSGAAGWLAGFALSAALAYRGIR